MTINTNKSMVCVDLGTNSMLALGMRVQPKSYQKLFDYYYMPRLGEGLIHQGGISQNAIQRTLLALQDLKNTLKNFHDTYEVHITASSAIREADNQKDVLDQLNQVFDHPIEVISGHEEARFSYMSMLDCYQENQHNMIFDIGGGSTEVITGFEKKIIVSNSHRFGTVKLLDIFFKQPNCADCIESAKQYVFEFLKPLLVQKHNYQFYGTAGSFTQTAALLRQVHNYSPEKIDGTLITRNAIDTLIETMRSLSLEDIQQLKGVDPQRADVILPGLVIIACLMEHFQITEINVYDRGVRYGKFFDVFYASSGW